MFTSLSLFALLQEPLTSFVTSLSSLVGSIGCFTRIQDFLESDVRIDNRSVQDTASSNGSWSSKSSHAPTEKIDGPVHEVRLLEGHSTRDLLNTNAIVVKSGSFGYDATKDANLKDITAEVPTGKFTMLVGPVGSGKSTLLKALLGEVTIMTGTVHVSGQEVAYCDQTPWHMNGTVRDSIIAFSPVDERWYQQVLQACALTQDLTQLSKGDLTTIGSKGIVLSGGQSQRVVSQYLVCCDQKMDKC